MRDLCSKFIELAIDEITNNEPSCILQADRWTVTQLASSYIHEVFGDKDQEVMLDIDFDTIDASNTRDILKSKIVVDTENLKYSEAIIKIVTQRKDSWSKDLNDHVNRYHDAISCLKKPSEEANKPNKPFFNALEKSRKTFDQEYEPISKRLPKAEFQAGDLNQLKTGAMVSARMERQNENGAGEVTKMVKNLYNKTLIMPTHSMH
jgi:hypothetical protein